MLIFMVPKPALCGLKTQSMLEPLSVICLLHWMVPDPVVRNAVVIHKSITAKVIRTFIARNMRIVSYGKCPVSDAKMVVKKLNSLQAKDLFLSLLMAVDLVGIYYQSSVILLSTLFKSTKTKTQR